jgi:hypothetical protein
VSLAVSDVVASSVVGRLVTAVPSESGWFRNLTMSQIGSVSIAGQGSQRPGVWAPRAVGVAMIAEAAAMAETAVLMMWWLVFIVVSSCGTAPVGRAVSRITRRGYPAVTNW